MRFARISACAARSWISLLNRFTATRLFERVGVKAEGTACTPLGFGEMWPPA